MTILKNNILKNRWDAEYVLGKYANEDPIKFIVDIQKNITCDMDGLYIGCGNGRNYVPLIQSSLRLTGIDISSIAISQIHKKIKNYDYDVICDSFENFKFKQTFDYIISIQIFQHGDDKNILSNFNKVEKLLNTGGLLFLRINSISADINHDYSIIDKNNHDGMTIKYNKDPKKI